MNVVVVAAAKGGVGKSTLSAALAIEAQRQGNRVALLDLDTLQCVARWHDQRVTNGVPSTPPLIDRMASVSAAVAHAAKAGFDWLVIDTAPASLARLQPAVDAADICIIPVRPSPLDVQSMDVVLELCDASRCSTLFVLNGVNPGSAMTDGARAYLQARKFDVWDREIALDEIHALAMMTGRTAAELAPHSPVAKEIKALWGSIEQLCEARKPTRQERSSTRRKRA